MIKRIKPDINTKFHIDMAWWQKSRRNLRRFLYDAYCSECKDHSGDLNGTEELDYVNPRTGEVRRMSMLWGRLVAHCSEQDDYITLDTPLTVAMFRTLLANGNEPLSPVELCERIGKSDPETVLRVLSGRTIYYGIMPVDENAG